MLKEGFPEWYDQSGGGSSSSKASEVTASTKQQGDQSTAAGESGGETQEPTATPASPPHIVKVLQYLRLAFCAPEIVDSVPLSSAANPSAWHAWRSYRAKALGEQRSQSPAALPGAAAASGDASSDRSLSPRAAQQPGGARRPGEWNWSGVFEDRVRKVVASSRADATVFGGGGELGDVVSCFFPCCSLIVWSSFGLYSTIG